MELKKRSGVGCWCVAVVAMDSSRRSVSREFKSITVLRHPVFLGSKPKENGVLGLRRARPRQQKATFRERIQQFLPYRESSRQICVMGREKIEYFIYLEGLVYPVSL